MAGKISGMGLGQVKKISGMGLGQVKKISGMGLGVIWQSFAQVGMTKNASAASLSTTMAKILGWTPETDSTVTSDALISNGSGTANITTSLTIGNSGISRTVFVELRIGGTAVASNGAGTSIPASGGTITFTTSAPIAVADAAAVEVWARTSGGTPTIIAPSYVRIIPT